MTPMEEPAVVSHYNVQPVIDIYGSVQGRDLGGVASRTSSGLPTRRTSTCRGEAIL